jgi:hypothetical protein
MDGLTGALCAYTLFHKEVHITEGASSQKSMDSLFMSGYKLIFAIQPLLISPRRLLRKESEVRGCKFKKAHGHQRAKSRSRHQATPCDIQKSVIRLTMPCGRLDLWAQGLC